MREIHRFEPEFARLLPASHALCQAAHLVVHDTVAQVFICGSRGLAGGSRPTSDIDLSLLVNAHELPPHEPEREQVLRSVLETTLSHWQGPVEADLAAVFDTFTCCGLRCYQTRTLDPAIVGNRGVDCFGIYKLQRGFTGYVRQGVEIAKIYPLLCIWNRPV